MFYKVSFCKVCQSKNNKILIKLPFRDKKIISFFKKFYKRNKINEIKNLTKNSYYELVKCDNCSFIWQKYHPGEKIQNKLYNDWISFKDSLKKTKNKSNYLFFNNTLKLVINKKSTNILDYGAGFGSFSIYAKNKKFSIYSLEASKKRVKYLKKFNLNILHYQKYKQFKNFFDLVYINQVVEHLDDLKKFFKILKYVSKKNCIVYVSVPEPKKINENIIKGPYQPLEHLNAFSNANLTKMFQMNHFKKLSSIELLKLYFKRKFSLFFLLKRFFYQNYSNSIIFKRH